MVVHGVTCSEQCSEQELNYCTGMWYHDASTRVNFVQLFFLSKNIPCSLKIKKIFVAFRLGELSPSSSINKSTPGFGYPMIEEGMTISCNTKDQQSRDRNFSSYIDSAIAGRWKNLTVVFQELLTRVCNNLLIDNLVK